MSCEGHTALAGTEMRDEGAFGHAVGVGPVQARDREADERGAYPTGDWQIGHGSGCRLR